EQLAHLFRIARLRERREADEVGEQHRDDAALGHGLRRRCRRLPEWGAACAAEALAGAGDVPAGRARQRQCVPALPAEAMADRVLGAAGGADHPVYISESSPTVKPGSMPGSLSSASRTPGVYASRERASWRIVSVSPGPPRMTAWCAFSPGSLTEWIGTSPCMRSAVSLAVPDGASSFAAWCSSTISARSMTRDASSANRIISTAPSAKLGA